MNPDQIETCVKSQSLDTEQGLYDPRAAEAFNGVWLLWGLGIVKEEHLKRIPTGEVRSVSA